MKSKFFRLPVFILVSIVIVGFILRFYGLTAVPQGLSQDETAIGYNAYSINTNGRDEHGEVMPLYFKSFGDYKLPVYIYLTSISQKIFGVNEFSVRFFSAFFGVLSIFVIYLLIKLITKKEDISIACAFLLAITPWHIHFSRSAFEVNVALFFSILGTYLFIKGAKGKNLSFLFMSVLSFSLSLYSYNVTRLLVPLILLILITTYHKKILQIGWVKIAFISIFTIILLIPFASTFFANEGVSSAKEALIFGSNALAKNAEIRGNVSALPVIIQKIFFNKWLMGGWNYIGNIASYFSSQFLFITGSSHGNQGIGNYGVFHLFELPLIIIGLYYFFKNKVHELNIIFAWGVAALLTAGLSYEVPHATRGYFLVIPFTVFAGFGLLCIYNYIKNNGKYKNLVAASLIGIIGFSLIYYLSFYFLRFPVLYAKAWREQDKVLSRYLADHKQNYDKVVIDEDSGFMYTSYLFYEKFSPVIFQKTSEYLGDNSVGYSTVKKFDKFEFRKIDWAKENDVGKILYVTGDKNTTINKNQIMQFDFPKRFVAFSSDAKVIQFPVTDVAYRLYE